MINKDTIPWIDEEEQNRFSVAYLLDDEDLKDLITALELALSVPKLAFNSKLQKRIKEKYDHFKLNLKQNKHHLK